MRTPLLDHTYKQVLCSWSSGRDKVCLFEAKTPKCYIPTMSTDRYDRHRIDQPLDDIAAAMEHNTTSITFGEDYQERDYVGAPIRGVSSSSSKRHTPYSSSRSFRGRDSRSDRDRSERERSLDGDDLPSNRVFVANLSYSTTWQHLKDHMRKAGHVLKCDVFLDASGNSRGMGLAVYEDAKGAESALRTLTNTELDGRKIYLRKDMSHREREKTGVSSYQGRGKPPSNPDATVFVGNLDYSITWQKLKDVFKVAGKVVNADILTDQSGKSKGLGEVQFEDQADALSAIALFHGQMLTDRPMTVRMDARANFQPDPLQLKLSALGAAPAIAGLSAMGSELAPSYGSRRRGEVIYEQKVSPPRYSIARDNHSDTIYSRRSSGFVGDVVRHSEVRRVYSPPRRTTDTILLDSGSVPYRSSSGARSGGFGDRDRRVGPPSRYSGGGSEGNTKLFVKNLNYTTSWQHLKDIFRGAGSVQRVDIMEGQDGRSKGCAMVYFDNPESARKAIDMFNDCEVDGRRLEVRYDRMI